MKREFCAVTFMVYVKRSPWAPVLEFPNLAEKVLPGGIMGKPPQVFGSIPCVVMIVCRPFTIPTAAAGFV